MLNAFQSSRDDETDSLRPATQDDTVVHCSVEVSLQHFCVHASKENHTTIILTFCYLTTTVPIPSIDRANFPHSTQLARSQTVLHFIPYRQTTFSVSIQQPQNVRHAKNAQRTGICPLDDRRQRWSTTWHPRLLAGDNHWHKVIIDVDVDVRITCFLLRFLSVISIRRW